MKDNYIKYTPIVTIAVVVIMSLVSLFAPTKLFSIKLKQANIYSSIVSGADLREFFGIEYPVLDLLGDEILDATYMASSKVTILVEEIAKERAAQAKAKELEERRRRAYLAYADNLQEQDSEQEELQQEQPVEVKALTPVRRNLSSESIIEIEDYSAGESYSKLLTDALELSGERNIRIAFMGDSYIEGDILTMDLRESLQSEYGGGGIGFVPITSPVARFRGTLRHKYSSDWESIYITKESQGAEYLLSGVAFRPKESSWVEYETVSFRKHSAMVRRASLLFINRGESTINIEVNGGEMQSFRPTSSDSIQVITIEESVKSLRYSFESVEGLTLYGVFLDDSQVGIGIDNFAIRGNSGLQMWAVSSARSREIRNMLDFNLIVLEYGLNIAGEENRSFGWYTTKMEKVIDHIKACYPDTPIVVMGVGDRATLEDGEPVTMASVIELSRMQQILARKCGVMFWNTIDAMRSLGGISKFVELNWATKDFTHINVLGGKQIAAKLYQAICELKSR